MTPRPPKVAEQLIAWSLPPADRSVVLGDLAEEFDALAAERGIRSARQWYGRQVRRSLVTSLRRRFEPAMPPERAGARPRAWFATFEGIGTDLRYTGRSLRDEPTFTIAAVLVLTLGVGASATIFSVVDAVVLRALPFDEPDRLVALGERSPSLDPLALLPVQPQNYLDWTAGQSVFESMAAFDPRSASGAISLREPGVESEDLTVLRVVGEFFEVLRVAPALGRTFLPDEVQGGQRVAVLSDALWRRRFGGDARIIGRVLELDRASYQVVGVLPPGVTYPLGGAATDLWIPIVIPADQRVRTPGHLRYLRSIARLKTGVSVPQAQAHMDQLYARLGQTDPTWHEDSGIGVEPLHDHVVGPLRGALMMLLGAVGLVLVIACVNVGSLLLARAAARAREFGIRAALGAGSGRLIRLFVIESLILSSLGTCGAILCATWTIPLLRDALPEGMLRAGEIALDLRVLAAAGGVTLLAALFFGVLPARPLRRWGLTLPLKSSARAGLGDLRAHRLQHLLVIAELALAVILLVGAALFIGSFLKMHGIDPGITTDRVLTMGLTPRRDAGGQSSDVAADYGRVDDRLATVAGVMHASIVSGGMTLRGGTAPRPFGVPGRPAARDDVGVSVRRVTPEYHLSLGIPLRRGRMFASLDHAGAPKVIIIGESVASRYFPGEDAIGRSAVIDKTAVTIVGVVGDIYDRSVEAQPRPLVYFPMAQSTAGAAELVVRTTTDPYAVVPAVKAAVLEVMPDVSIRNVTTVGEIQVQQRGTRRLRMLIMGLFAATGLAVSAVGLYGLMAFFVSRRTREIGVHIALGASPARLIGTVLTHGGVVVAIGLAIGGVGAWLLRSVAGSMLFPGLEPGDPRAFAAAAGVLSLAAFMAVLIPARRATRVDPVVVLKAE